MKITEHESTYRNPSTSNASESRDPNLFQKLQDQAKLEPVELPDITIKSQAGDSFETPREYVQAGNTGDSKYTRIPLVSQGVFNGIDSVQMREFKVDDLALIYKSVETRSISLLIDAVGNTLYPGVDVRDLTTSDFYFLMHHHRISEYPKSPWVVNWTSRYGNQNKLEINGTTLKLLPPSITRQEYLDQYQVLGITHPTVRDLEVAESAPEDEAQEFLINRAQYLIGSNFGEKIEKIKDASISFLEEIREFNKVSKHGVEESLWVQDKHFEPNAALEFLTKASNELGSALEHADFDVTVLRDKHQEMLNEIEIITKSLQEGRQVVPAREEVGVKIDALKFFPSL